MDNSTLIAIIVAAVVVALLVVVYLIRAGTDTPDTMIPHDDSGTAGASSAVNDVLGEFIGVDANPDIAFPLANGPADPLTLIKGLGPKASGLMAEAGIIRFDQLAALTPQQQQVLDEKMGTFRGRMARDRWIEQAQHLATGDNAGFEAKFGKLGG